MMSKTELYTIYRVLKYQFFHGKRTIKNKIVYELHSLKSKVSYTQEDTVWYSIDNSTLKALRDKSGIMKTVQRDIYGKSQNLFPQNLVKNFPRRYFCGRGATKALPITEKTGHCR